MRNFGDESSFHYNEENTVHRLTQYSPLLAETQSLDSTIETQTIEELPYHNLSMEAQLFLVLVLVGAFLLTRWVSTVFATYCKRKEQDKKKKSIYFHLRNLNVEDVDLRRAPTGGYHGTYTNKLADGINYFGGFKRKDTNSTSSENTIIEEYDEDPPIIIDLDLEAGAKGRQDGKYYLEDHAQRASFLKRPKSSDLFVDTTSSIPYLGERNRDDDYADDFGITPETSRGVKKHPWRTAEEETI
eukprot:jgi/Psemu1/305185/fgenesh1_kg.185_\